MASSMPSRPYDALYDPTYTVSGARDHYRQQGSSGFLIDKVPDHANLFSELQHHPTSTFRIAADDKVPAFVDRSFHPQQRQLGQLQQQSLAQQVNGRQQYKYFRRPQLPPGTRLSAPLHLTQQQQPAPEPPALPDPAIKDAYTQSDYRESEAQTLPWSPGWLLPSDPAMLAKQALLSAKFNCQGPEVLQLADLKFGDGLPGGLQEVQRLEKVRHKRAFEASLPPLDDAARLPERQALIEAWEAAEWAEREGEIHGVQEERLELLQAALKVREEEIEEAHRAQVEQRSAALLAAKAQKFATIHSRRIKTIRQLAACRKAVDAAARGSSGSGGSSSIIDKYADYGSPVYAPLQREGRCPDAIKPSAAAGPAAMSAGSAAGAGGRELPDIQSLAPSSLAGLQELQASLPARALQPKLQRPKPPAKLNYSQRAEIAVQQDVETISNLLQSAKATHGRGVGQVWPHPIDHAALNGSCGAGSGGRPGSNRRSVGVAAALSSHGDSAAQQQQVVAAGKAGADSSKAPVGARTGERPPTLDAPPLPDVDGQHAALVLLQRLLRGRAVQNDMYAGKTARLQLVRELCLGLEGTAGHQPRPEVRDAATQELDAAIGAAVCSICCLLASEDEAAITQLLLGVVQRQQQQLQQQHQVQLDPQWLEPAEEPEQQQQQQQLNPSELMAGSTSSKQLQESLGVDTASQEEQLAEQSPVADAADTVGQQEAAIESQQQSLVVNGEEREQQQQQQQQQEPVGKEEHQLQLVPQAAKEPDANPQPSTVELAELQLNTAAIAGVLGAVSSDREVEDGMQQHHHSRGGEEGLGTYAAGVAAAAESSDVADAASISDAAGKEHSGSSSTAEEQAPQHQQQQQQHNMQVMDQGGLGIVSASAEHDAAGDAEDVTSIDMEAASAASGPVQPPAAAGSRSAGKQVIAEGSSGLDAVAGRAVEASLAGGVLLSGGGLGVPADASYSGSGGHGSGAVSGVGSQFSLGAGVHVDEPESEDAARTPSMLKPRGLHAILGGEEGEEDQEEQIVQEAEVQQEASVHSSSSSSSSSSSEGEEQ